MMPDTVPSSVTAIVTLLAAVGTFLTTLVGAYLSLRNGMKADANKEKLDVVHAQINGMQTARDELIAKSSKAEGVLEEKDRNIASHDSKV